MRTQQKSCRRSQVCDLLQFLSSLLPCYNVNAAQSYFLILHYQDGVNTRDEYNTCCATAPICADCYESLGRQSTHGGQRYSAGKSAHCQYPRVAMTQYDT